MDVKTENGTATPKAPSTRPAVITRNSSMNGPLYRQAENKKNIVTRRVMKRKEDGWVKSLARWLVENQIGLSFNLLALLFLAHFLFSKAQPFTYKFFTLCYYNPNTGKYAAGLEDFYFMVFCVVLFTGLRALFMEHLLAPLARHWGITQAKTITRFSEQAWLLIYCCVVWPLGMYIYTNSPYFLNMAELWTNWPDRELTGVMKGYMLAQWSFWIQQVLVIHIEERRKDHWQMLTHHFITIILIASAYAYHQTRVGNLILVLMDVVDLFLPLGKCLKYLGYTTACDIFFGMFMVSWFIARHVLYMMTCWSVHVDAARLIPNVCYSGSMDNLTGPFSTPEEGYSHVLEPFVNPTGIVCFNDNIRNSFLASLLFLQVLTLMWFVVIVRVAMKVLKGGSPEDLRSGDEAEEDEGEEEVDSDEEVTQSPQPLEEEVGVEAIDLKRRVHAKRVSVTSTTGVSLPGHSDRRELLNRIGCEKQIE
ncbi:TLC domain-containing protein [Diplogelasinospora grovesii]|uniref:TLC domain-containing protein n=1 Tax=Diplogelasinospora grovesii TaxID=303347 RepID=A0AAN6NBK6_9PEZI|nr:TLC domain-containing protein [Diplogelasinospora grovesii]